MVRKAGWEFTWTGPYKIKDLLAQCMSDAQPWPPPSEGVYVVTRRRWTQRPTAEAYPLYVGGNTGGSQRFCTRVGDLLADMFGFFDGNTGHHSGGQSLNAWCLESGVHPWSLYLGWATMRPWCNRCAETRLWKELTLGGASLLNKRLPPACRQHRVLTAATE